MELSMVPIHHAAMHGDPLPAGGKWTFAVSWGKLETGEEYDSIHVVDKSTGEVVIEMRALSHLFESYKAQRVLDWIFEEMSNRDALPKEQCEGSEGLWVYTEDGGKCL